MTNFCHARLDRVTIFICHTRPDRVSIFICHTRPDRVSIFNGGRDRSHHTTAWQAILMHLKSRSGGRSARQMSVACGQRGWKVQLVNP